MLGWSNNFLLCVYNYFSVSQIVKLVRIKGAYQISASSEDCKLCLDTFPVGCGGGGGGCEEQ